MSGIPVTIHLERETFVRLERIARNKRTTMRQLIVVHLDAAVDPDRTAKPRRRAVGVTVEQVDAWVRMAGQSYTNTQIAAVHGVSAATVSKWLLSRGIRRHRERGSLTHGSG